jgi:hypothetical protein
MPGLYRLHAHGNRPVRSRLQIHKSTQSIDLSLSLLLKRNPTGPASQRKPDCFRCNGIAGCIHNLEDHIRNIRKSRSTRMAINDGVADTKLIFAAAGSVT